MPAMKWLPATVTDVPLIPVVGETLFAVGMVTVNVPADFVFVPSVALTGKLLPVIDASVNDATKLPVVELAVRVVV